MTTVHAHTCTQTYTHAHIHTHTTHLLFQLLYNALEHWVVKRLPPLFHLHAQARIDGIELLTTGLTNGAPDLQAGLVTYIVTAASLLYSARRA